ncbi:MAG TPA: D-2-hydroxyacid dehydrogenase [Anaerolineales bacterium]|nr:D-2-hydroxyacid dehydrogenase [Anaerolineales bacterium]
MTEKIQVLVTLPLADELLEELSAVSDRIELNVHPTAHASEIPDEVWAEVEVLYTMHTLPDAEQAPNLSWIQSYLAGIDKIIQGPLLQERSIQLTTMSGANTSQVAEHVLTMMLALGHNLPGFMALQSENQWMQEKGQNYVPLELRGQVVGIIGYGSIGRQVARLARAFGADVLAIKRNVMQPEDDGFSEEDMGDPGGDLFTRLYPPEAMRSMFKLCDFVAVTVPLTDQTKEMVGKEHLAALSPSAFLVDVSRGGVVDHAALVEALENGELAGAALDVFPEEPLPEESPLWQMNNVIITPHVAGFSPAYNRRANRVFAENLRRYLDENELLNLVDFEKEY